MLSLLLLGALLQQPSAQQTPAAEDAPKGQVLFEKHSDDQPAPPQPKPVAPGLHSRVSSSNPDTSSIVADSQRHAIGIESYDLDLHLNLDTGASETRARLKITNTSNAPIQSVPLQVSSSLRWESAQQDGAQLELHQHPLDTDTDHTGTVSEAVLTLPSPLASGASTMVDLFYSGTLVENGDRLIALGANDAQASISEWDGFNSAAPVSGVRGFGNVTWYPVAQTPVQMGNGNRLFTQVAESRVTQRNVPFHLRLTVETTTSLSAALFCGKTQMLTPLDTGSSASQNTEPADKPSPRIYTAEWTLPHIGLRAPSLFLAAPAPTEPSSGLMTVFTPQPEKVAGYDSAALKVQPLMQAWFGAQPLEKLTLLDLGSRNAIPFEDGAMVALPLRAKDSGELTSAMSQWLTHAWFHADEAWMTEGLATFMQQMWQEKQLQGERGATAAPQVDETSLRALSLYDAEPTRKEDDTVSTSSPAERTPLTHCAEPICYRTKGAAVWRMLRYIVGEEPLQLALQSLHTRGEANAEALQDVLEKTSGKDLSWFFEDWVFHDRGLPDLSIVAIAPRSLDAPVHIGPLPPGQAQLPERDKSKPNGWMVAVEVRNDGGAAAEVPITLHGAGITTTDRLRIAAHSVATLRVVMPAAPDNVQVNDGTVPEVGNSTHTRAVTLQQR